MYPSDFLADPTQLVYTAYNESGIIATSASIEELMLKTGLSRHVVRGRTNYCPLILSTGLPD